MQVYIQIVPNGSKGPSTSIRHAAQQQSQGYAPVPKKFLSHGNGLNGLVSSLPLLRSHSLLGNFKEVREHTKIHMPQAVVPCIG